MTLTNYSSGELEISTEGRSIRLTRNEANRLVMAARMHGVSEFLKEIPKLIPEGEIVATILGYFEKAGSSSGGWTLKEKFARLQTLTKDYQPEDPNNTVEKVEF